MIKIKYVGRKPFSVDNVSGSKAVWDGNGSVREVTRSQAKRLLSYPDQWQLDDERDAAEVALPDEVTVIDEDGESVQIDEADLNKPLERMTKSELVAFAQARYGRKLDSRKSTKNLIDQIEALGDDR